MTYQSTIYRNVCKQFAAHEAVNHSVKEWALGAAHSNTIENYFSVFKRGMNTVYQHCSGDQLHRYLAEFDFRYNHHRSVLKISDKQRANAALKTVEGKRLI